MPNTGQPVLNQMMDIWKDAVKAEFGNFKTIPVPPDPETGDRLIIVPEGSTSRDDWHIAYVTGGRLILDDYVPEAFDGTV